MSMLEINHLKANYGKLEVLNDVTFSLVKGEIAGILGVNGAGKTTLFNALFYNNHITKYFRQANEIIKQDDIGYIESDNVFYPFLSVEEFLTLVNEENMVLSKTMCETFDLPFDKLTNELSTGQRKKLSIIANLICDKKIYFMDEPFNGLDFESYEILQKLLKSSYFSNKYVIISSHILESLNAICSKILYIENGRIAREFPKDNFNEIKYSFSDQIKDGIQKLVNALEKRDKKN